MEQEEQLPDLATDVLLVSGRKKPQENLKKTTPTSYGKYPNMNLDNKV